MKHFYPNIPGWAGFAALYPKVVAEAPQRAHFVEVGSWLGRSACLMAVEIINSGKLIRFDCVDPWTDGGPDLRDTGYFKKLTESPYTLFLRNIEPVKEFIRPIRMESVEASKHYEDRSLDFIMLDGDHAYEGIRADIDAWLPKMKPGSLFSGDDYLWPGVKKAVDETFGNRAIVVCNKAAGNYKNSVSHWTVRL